MNQTQGGFTTRGRYFEPHVCSFANAAYPAQSLSGQVWASSSPGPTGVDHLNPHLCYAHPNPAHPWTVGETFSHEKLCKMLESQCNKHKFPSVNIKQQLPACFQESLMSEAPLYKQSKSLILVHF